MKSFLVIGLGRFGRHVCRSLMSQGAEVMAVDSDEEKVDALADKVTKAQIADCSREEVLKSLGVGNYDACLVCMGSDFQSSLETTSLLSELGAQRVISKAGSRIQEKFLLRNGADEVVYPEREMAGKLARRLISGRIADYLELTEDVSLFQMEVSPAWAGRTIADLNFRKKYNANIVAVKKGENVIMPMPDYRFEKNDEIMVICNKTDMNKLLKKG
ncbi:MAG: TrkA family potassium uptake protein [Eubacterium sp.]|nr:TrkA family potassium uptake protein [Eubacterium sp.]